MNDKFTILWLATVFWTAPLFAQESTPPRSRQPAPRAVGGTPSGPKTVGDYSSDVVVVREAQGQALEQVQEMEGRAEDVRARAGLETAVKEMERSLALLEEAKKSPEKLPAALAAQQAAYQALLKLAARETQVSRSRSQRSSSSAGQASQQQLEQLDLKQEENKYETQRQASPQQNSEQREQLQAENRLKELAQRQQDLNERLKELQNALQEAKTEAEREEIRRRLKRLGEEEQEMLADIDELRQRMEQPQNQSKMAEARQQLDQTRSDVQKAAEALERESKESASQALASGTRAQRDLQQLRDEFRKNNSKQFSEEMRQMRSEARQLAEKQEALGEKLAGINDATNKPKSLADSGEKKALVDELQKQQAGLTNLLGEMRSLSEQTETTEPLLSKQLYDTLRKIDRAESAESVLPKQIYDMLRDKEKGSVEDSLGIASELIDKGAAPLAQRVEQQARKQIDELKKGVEHAAESVLGDDTEALRLAKRELDELTRQLESEIARTERGAGGGQKPNSDTNLVASAGPGAGTNTVAAQGRGEGSEQRADAQNGRQPDQSAQNPGKEPGDQTGQSAGKQGPSAQASENQSGQQAGAQGTGGKQPGPPAQDSQGQNEPQDGGPQGDSQPGQARKSSENQQAQRPGQQPGQGPQAQQGQGGSRPQSANSQPRPGQPNSSGGRSRGAEGDNAAREFFDSAQASSGGRGGTGPITGEDFVNWSDRLRDVEEMIDQPGLRNEVARVRERARAMRVDLKRQSKVPDRGEIKTQLAIPLAEVRNRIVEELARRESKEALVPIDRDPVPSKFTDLVRRYYEKLGNSE